MGVTREAGQGVVQAGVIGATTGIDAEADLVAVPPVVPEDPTANHTADPKDHIVDLNLIQSQDQDHRVVIENQ